MPTSGSCQKTLVRKSLLKKRPAYLRHHFGTFCEKSEELPLHIERTTRAARASGGPLRTIKSSSFVYFRRMSDAPSVSGHRAVMEESNELSVSGHASISEGSKSSGNTGSAFSLGESRSSHSNGRDSSTRDDEYIGTKNQSTTLEKAKALILFFLFALAGLTGWMWWRDATDARQDLYRAEFEQYGEKVAQVFLERVQYRATAAASLATSLSAQALGASVEWPFVTFTNFERRVASTRRLTQSTSIWVAPLVTAEQRAPWEAYAVEHQDFRTNEAFADSFLTATDATPIYKPTNWPINKGMFQYNGNQTRARDDGPTHFMPIWQAAPNTLTSGIAMFDQVSESMRGKVLDHLIDTPLFSPKIGRAHV